MRILILDDDFERHDFFERELAGHDLLHVHTAVVACAALTAGPRFDWAFLDHDLNDFQSAGHENTGLVVAQHVASMPKDARPAKVWIHSWNPGGATRMAEVLNWAWVNFVRCPFSQDMFRGWDGAFAKAVADGS